ncbi:MAG TPA: hypothetical protein IAB45_06785 [Candidatus Onthousia faecavium]|nr:hypothetical protein [Candidatus Onthousia faecavium]
MKNSLFYYYQLNVQKLIKNKNYYFFEDDNYFYYLYLINRPLSYIGELAKLNNMLVNSKFMFIVPNINRDIVSLINNRYYVLLRNNKNLYSPIEDIYNPYYCTPDMTKLTLLNHSNWESLWSSKIDYFEYQKDYIKIKYPLLYKSLDYYIGLSEIALSYFNTINNREGHHFPDNFVISRRRINLKDNSFYNPLNIVIDHRARDIGNYLQYIFLENSYTYEEIGDFLNALNLNNYQYSLVMARIIFPSFYFDIYENIINGYEKETKILNILKRNREYERYLKTIYFLINKNQSISRIDWLEN